MAGKLAGKSAVVTGAGSKVGIGKEVALAMAAEGARVVANDIARDPDGAWAADRVVSEIKSAGGTAVASYDSVTTMTGGANIINTAVSNFGRIDILVNCAGNVIFAPITEITEQQWDAVINVHLKGHFSCIKAAVPEMIKQKSGRIINFSSICSLFGFQGKAISYNVVKSGIMGLTASLADGLKQHGITVNAILPEAVTQLFPFKDRKGQGDNMLLPQWMEPDYVAPVVVYLATDEAQYITSRFIHAAGGDICVYGQPFQIGGDTHILIRKMGKWTVDELHQALSDVLVKH
jgi:NAD(P)-dependent dehydrogenase (short-subunit alcohol dehydrogenase family)